MCRAVRWWLRPEKRLLKLLSTGPRLPCVDSSNAIRPVVASNWNDSSPFPGRNPAVGGWVPACHLGKYGARRLRDPAIITYLCGYLCGGTKNARRVFNLLKKFYLCNRFEKMISIFLTRPVFPLRKPVFGRALPSACFELTPA